MRGPEEGQVTLTAKPTVEEKDRQRRDSSSEHSLETRASHEARHHSGTVSDDHSLDLDEYNTWTDGADGARDSVPTRDVRLDRDSVDTLRPDHPCEEENEATPRVLDVVRIPNSQLRFFPKPRKPPDGRARSSLEQDVRRTSHEREVRRPTGNSLGRGPSIQNDLRTLPGHFLPPPPPPPKPPKSSNIVRLRPPQPQAISASNNLADRLSSLFVVPPPPMSNQAVSRANARLSLDSTFSSPPDSRRSSVASSPAQISAIKQPEVLLEMQPRRSVEMLGTANPVDREKKLR